MAHGSYNIMVIFPQTSESLHLVNVYIFKLFVIYLFIFYAHPGNLLSRLLHVNYKATFYKRDRYVFQSEFMFFVTLTVIYIRYLNKELDFFLLIMSFSVWLPLIVL